MEGNIIMLSLGIIMVLLGIANLKGNISTVHWYNRHRVTEEDVSKYGKFMGLGSITIGFSVILTAVLMMIFNNEIFYYISVAGIIAGITLMLYAQIKFNKGIF